MTTMKTLLVGAAVGAVLAAAALGAATKLFQPQSAAQVATELARTAHGDPLAPPDFYGSR